MKTRPLCAETSTRILSGENGKGAPSPNQQAGQEGPGGEGGPRANFRREGVEGRGGGREGGRRGRDAEGTGVFSSTLEQSSHVGAHLLYQH